MVLQQNGYYYYTTNFMASSNVSGRMFYVVRLRVPPLKI